MLARGWLVDALPPDWLAQARALDVVAIHCDHTPLTREQVQAIKAEGLGVWFDWIYRALVLLVTTAQGADGSLTRTLKGMP